MRKKPAASRATKSSDGLILFAHGSRNPAWRKPFDRLLADVVKRHHCRAVLAFDEYMTPSLVKAAQSLAQAGVRRAVIVPLFLGGGLHVRDTLPKLAAQARAASGLRLRVARAIGDDVGVLRAIADYSITTARPRAKTTSARRKPS